MKLILAIIIMAAFNLSAQDTNKVVIDSTSGKAMLVGVTTREAFADTNFAWWYNSGYEFYEVDTATVDLYKEKLIETDILIVMGTWCSDSRREVPNFFKILDYAGYPEEKLKIFNVERNKQSRDPQIQELQVELVPTFIFYSSGEEIGRIIETPQSTLEEDMAEIVK